MIKLFTDYPENVLAFSAEGMITGDDYESVIIPAVEAKLEKEKKVRLLYYIGGEYSGFELKALWDDAKVGFQHLKNWEKIALVSDIKWMQILTKIFGFIIPCPVKVFNNDQFSQAREWVCS